MKKNIAMLGIIAVVLAVFSISSAQAVLITSFESPPSPHLLDNPETAVTYWQGTDLEYEGITDGTQSLGAYIPANGWGCVGMYWHMDDGSSMAAAFKAADFLQYDVTVPVGSGTETDNLWMHPGFQGDGQGWTVDWGVGSNVGDNKVTVSLNLAPYKAGWAGTGNSWWQLWWQYGSGEARVVYIDNIRLVQIPEPATLVLLAMGGLALLIWRRR